MTILVIGNATVDLSFEVDHLPRPGETLLARSRMIDAGGKGLNQAIVAHRAGADVAYVTAIGEDQEGEIVSRRLLDEEMDIAHLQVRKGATDQSIIYLDPKGENAIVSTAAMAASLGTLDAEVPLASLKPGDLLLMQGNLSRTTTEACLIEARRRGARTLLNPAPIAFDYAGLWPMVDVAIVNEVESRVLGGIEPHDAAARRLLELGTGAVIVTLGAAGALVVTRDAVRPVPAPAVPVVDTAGAGDVFCGVLAAALAQGRNLVDAVPLAVAAASLAVTRRGTSSAFPSAAELAALEGSA
jgi:ribokinase